MPRYLFGVVIAFFEPVFHGGCNIIDHFLSAKVFPRLTTLVFFGKSVTLLFLPIVWYLSPPTRLSPLPLALVFGIACIEVLYNFPYYYALRVIDTSIVASLFSIGRIFVPILAYIVVGERLLPVQYFGFALITVAALALTFDRSRLRFNSAVFLMGFVSLILAVETIMYKYAFTHGASWGSVVVPMMLFEFCIIALGYAATGGTRTVRADFGTVRASWKLFFGNEFFGWLGNMGDSFGVSVLPATVARAIGSTQPIFTLLYASLFKRKYPGVFREQLGTHAAIKLIWFSVIIVGVVLVVSFGATSV
ncbi:MAG: hypothetical protein KGI41_03805 [Patescibacteria group bacterium]|nr:DMT family transporter [Patescibacteria group bacterium]MDE1966336.1 hypothetical protein [Patescibacteria group bacterium]